MKEILGSHHENSNSFRQNLTYQQVLAPEPALGTRLEGDVLPNDYLLLLIFVYSFVGPHGIEERRERAQGQGQILTYQHRPLGHKPQCGLGNSGHLSYFSKPSDPQGQ